MYYVPIHAYTQTHRTQTKKGHKNSLKLDLSYGVLFSICPFSPVSFSLPSVILTEGSYPFPFPLVCTTVTWVHFRSITGPPTVDLQIPWKGLLGSKSLTPEHNESSTGVPLKAQVPYKPSVYAVHLRLTVC